ncbi:MAG TPA: TetR/AcrR family transcriptional regulator [Parvularculaceae bacterium]|nr:TetR/AcrR family transcriptional regulator [Caulobacterales bacterium]HPE32399.1 TetR/AcrR family transcriptional regulator [Parvularculaceae bacterium]HRX39421.1 TetR/AcrR family transcriptional regulator [Parvularculaceae bacterium]
MSAREAIALKSEDRREKILQAAERCFVASGFHGARMAQIAKEAGMSPGHVYHYFDSKEQIIAEMVRAHSGEKREMVERFEAAGDKLVDHMVDNLEESIDSSTDPFWSALTLEMAAEATRNPEIAEVLRSTDCEIKSRVVACLAGQSGKEDIETRLEVLIALFQGLGVRNIINPELDKAAVIRVVKEVVETLFRRTGSESGDI